MTKYLSPAQIERWSEDGFLKVKGFLSEAETAGLRRWVADIEGADAQSTGIMHHFERTTEGIRPSRTENFLPSHRGLKDLLTRGKILSLVSELMGETAVVYKEKINYKYPGGGGYIAHQDAPAYEFISFHVTCLIAVDAATVESGCLSFSPGLHRQGLIAPDDRGCIEPQAAARMKWVPVEKVPGDVLCFSSYVPHKSGGNHSDQPRRIIYVTYNALSAGDFREQYYADKRRTFADHAREGSEKEELISKIGHFQGRTVLK